MSADQQSVHYPQGLDSESRFIRRVAIHHKEALLAGLLATYPHLSPKALPHFPVHF